LIARPATIFSPIADSISCDYTNAPTIDGSTCINRTAVNEGMADWLYYGRVSPWIQCQASCPLILQLWQQDGKSHGWFAVTSTLILL
jgi:hypothetical protein